MKKVMITGGAGFIGSHLTAHLLKRGCQVIVVDKMTEAARKYDRLRHLRETEKHLYVYTLDLVEEPRGLTELMTGVDTVFHLAANGDVAGGVMDTYLDFRNNVEATQNVMEACRKAASVQTVLFSSSAAVYGGGWGDIHLDESHGPLLPESMYGGSKLACEGIVSAFCHLFDMQGLIFRFANVVGGRMDHGIIHDLLAKLTKNPNDLTVLGDGMQVRPFFLVEDCISAMLHVYGSQVWAHSDVFNIGVRTHTTVQAVANIVVDEFRNLHPGHTNIHYTGGRTGFVGDLPEIRFSMEKMVSMGWGPSHTSNEAVHIATRRMLETYIP